MNEQIRQLAEQAKEHANHLDNIGVDASMEDIFNQKFAELIVQECVAQIRPMWNQVKEVGAPPGYDYDTFDLAYNDCMNAIKEHFGVEE
jgi:FAD synthase